MGLYLNRLDLVLWFAPLGPRRHHQWLPPLLTGLLEEDGPGFGSLPEPTSPRANGERWCAVRAFLYDYRFDVTGGAGWWRRERKGPLLVAVRKEEAGGPCGGGRVPQVSLIIAHMSIYGNNH